MPTYVYKFVETGETVEIQQSFNDDTLTEAVHPETGVSMTVKKVFQPVGVTFKGDGFYKTDSRSKNGKSAGSSSTNGDSAPSSGEKSSGEKTSADKSSGEKSSGEKSTPTSSGEKSTASTASKSTTSSSAPSD